MHDARTIFGLDEAQYDLLRPHRMPTAIPSFLQRRVVAATLEYCRVDEKARKTVLDRLHEILDSAEAVALVAGLADRVFPSAAAHGVPTVDLEDPSKWPDVDRAGDLLGIGYLLVGTAMVPLVKEIHRSLGVPEGVTRQTCRQIAAFCLNHQTAYDGKPGILSRQLYWLRHYPAGRLFRIGRFEYMTAEYHHAGPVYRHHESGRVVVFADPGRWVRGDGRVLLDEKTAPENEKEEIPPFRPTLETGDNWIAGHLIDPRGIVAARPTRISLTEWSQVLAPGDPVLDMHIPAGGGMHLELCRDSLAGAFEFFDAYFPDHGADAVVCRSWIFNTQMEERMPDSNLARLMQEAYLVPAWSTGRDGLSFVFCRAYDSLAEYPRNTRLQRALLDVLESGDTLRTTGMIYFRRELSEFGTMPYRRGLECFA